MVLSTITSSKRPELHLTIRKIKTILCQPNQAASMPVWMSVLPSITVHRQTGKDGKGLGEAVPVQGGSSDETPRFDIGADEYF